MFDETVIGHIPTEAEPRPIGAFGVILRGPRLFPRELINVVPRVLLVHRNDYDLWNLPGGGIGPNEPLPIGVKREVFEEAGLEVRPLFDDDSGLYKAYINALPIDPHSSIPGLRTKDSYALIMCAITGGRLVTTDESNRFGWFSLADLPPNTYERHQLMEQIRLLATPQQRRSKDLISLLYENEKALFQMRHQAK